MMMLHAEQLDASQVQPRTWWTGSRDAGHARLVAAHVEQSPEVHDALSEGAQRLGILQVADVLRDERMVPLGQAERVLQLRPAGKHRPAESEPDRSGSGT